MREHTAWWGVARASAVIACIGGALAATPPSAAAQAQQALLDFRMSPYGFVPQTVAGRTTNPWQWRPGSAYGWTVGATRGAWERLLSPTFTTVGSSWSIELVHSFKFLEPDVFQGGALTCFEGATVFASFGGRPFGRLTPSSGQTYTAFLGGDRNPLAGQYGFCGISEGLVATTFRGTGGTAPYTAQFAFDTWSPGPLPEPPAWRLVQLTLVGFVTAPEPRTWVLLGTGLLALGGVAARRRRGAV